MNGPFTAVQTSTTSWRNSHPVKSGMPRSSAQTSRSNGSDAGSNTKPSGGRSVINAASSQSGWWRLRVWNSTRARLRYENVKLE